MIVAVSGGKGGVGKSLISLNLARQLGAVLVEGNLTTGEVPTGSGPNFHDVLAGRVEPTEAIIEHASVPVLGCGNSLEGARSISLERFESAIQTLARDYEWVVIDSPPGLARDVGVELNAADMVVLVTAPNSAALESAQITRELALKVDTPVIAVILNRANEEAYEELVADIESRMTASVFTMPARLELRDAHGDKKPVQELYPNSPVVARFNEIVNHVMDGKERIQRKSQV